MVLVTHGETITLFPLRPLVPPGSRIMFRWPFERQDKRITRKGDIARG